MAKNKKVESFETSGFLAAKGFFLGKSCGSSTPGLIRAVTLNYLDNLIVAQNTIYSNLIYFSSFIEQEGLPQNKLGEKLQQIIQQSAEINDFTVFCKEASAFDQILQFGSSLLNLNSTSNEQEVSLKLEVFSKRFNVQINIYDSEKQTPSKFAKNRYTDCLVLTLFKSPSDCYSLYHNNFKDLNTANQNVSAEFDSSRLKLSKDFIQVSGVMLAMSSLSHFIIPPDMIRTLQSKWTELSRRNVIWPFYSLFERFCQSNPCARCGKLKSSTTFGCGCSLCYICTSLSNTNHRCSQCGRFLQPLDMNLIKS